MLTKQLMRSISHQSVGGVGGGWVGYGIQTRKDRREYATWWNENAILGFKVESLKSVLNIRALVKPGITYIDFGSADLMFDIETNDCPFLKSIKDCREFVQKELERVNVRFF